MTVPNATEKLFEVAATAPFVPSDLVRAARSNLEGERKAFVTLSEITSRLASIRDPFEAQRVLEFVLEQAVLLVGAERGALVTLEDGEVRLRASNVRQGDAFVFSSIELSHSLLEKVMTSGQGVNTTNAQEDPNFNPTASILALDIRSVLAVPLWVRDEVIGALYVDTQLMQRAFTAADQATLETFASQAGLAVRLTQSIEHDRQQYVGLVKTMLEALDARDDYTAGHSERVGAYTRDLAAKMNWAQGDQERALFAGWVHDIGKIGIRDELLFKPGRLEPVEREKLQEHTVIGERILGTAPLGFEAILPAVRNHHERWDGNGYPDGISGETIPLLARMIGIADTFDAITTTRPYSQPRTWDQAFDILRAEAGKQFDPNLVPLFIEALEARRALEAARNDAVAASASVGLLENTDTVV